MQKNRGKNPRRHDYQRKPYSFDGDDDDYDLFLESTRPLSTIAKLQKTTEELIGIQQKPQNMIDWLPVLSIILAVIICFIAVIVLCQRQLKCRQSIHSRRNRRQNNRNNNSNDNPTSSLDIDAAECIDSDAEFIAGMNINLAKGNLILNDKDARMLNSMSTFDRLQYFQNLTYLAR